MLACAKIINLIFEKELRKWNTQKVFFLTGTNHFKNAKSCNSKTHKISREICKCILTIGQIYVRM